VDGVEYDALDVTVTTPTNNILGDITWSHWMGTDANGYDVFTRLMYGGRVSLTIGFVVVILETILGVILGGLAGYFGKWVDQLIMRIVDILSCIPSLPIMLILSALFDSLGLGDSIAKLYYMMVVLTLMGWTGTARLVRGQILSLREQEFMLAAKCSGLSTTKKIFKHLMPNVIPQLIVSMTLGLGSIILTEATLGYLGIGAPLDTATWGNMINLASNETYREFYPNLWLGSGICITLAILAFNFVGDGLRDAFDPKMKR
jgi:peptide/nickel transport system permease protein